MGMKKQDNILIFVTSIKRAKFFKRLVTDVFYDKNIFFITYKKSVYDFLKDDFANIYYLSDFKNCEIDNRLLNFVKFHQDEAILVDKKIGLFPCQKLINSYYYVSKCFYCFYKKFNIHYTFVFNGYGQYLETSFRLISEFFNKKLLFFEIGNFSSKIFVDKKGVNAASSLMHKRLDMVKNFNESKFQRFKEGYLREKENFHYVPQSSNVKKEFLLKKLLDYNIKVEPSLLRVFVNKIKQKFVKKQISFDSINIQELDYIFFPLQVSYDSQILRFSSYNIFQAIDKAYEIAKMKGLKLVIKPHPAELNLEVLEYAKSKDVYLVNENTYQLLKNSKEVITINSTVGLESFYYKPLTVLGETWYKKYANADKKIKDKILFNYLFNILVDGDYFNENIKFDEIKIRSFLND